MGTLSFEGAQFDALIALHGEVPTLSIFEQYAGVPLIAADGAAASLVDLDVFPEYVVGDLDSLNAEALRAINGISELVFDPDQNSNDFEKSLRFASAQFWTRVLIVGLHGGDLEHTLNNWSVLMKFAPSMHLTVLDRDRYIIPVASSFTTTLQPDELVSLIPQPSARLSTKGLQWELQDEELRLGMREGARNIAVDGNVEIVIHEGSLLFCCNARIPWSPMFSDAILRPLLP